MGRILAQSVMVVFLVLGAASSQADVIYDNGDPNGFIVLTSDYTATILDDFELEAGASTITDFHWYGAYYEDLPQADDFELYIFDENYNLLHTIDGSGTTRVGTGNTVDIPIVGGDYDEYYYELFIDPLALSANTTYYFGIANSNDADWAWEYAPILDDSATLWYRPSDDFVEGPGDFAFDLTGDLGEGGVVPEPASMTMLGLGLVLVAVRKKLFA